MNDINKIIQELYGAYVDKNITLMKSLIDQGKELDPNNPYIKKYEGIYNSLNNNPQDKTTNNEETKSIKFGGKNISCPHCGANLSMSEHNKNEIENYKGGKSKELNFKCNYCNASFLWNEKGLKSIYLNISVGNEINIEGNKYRVSGGVRYIGNWKTNNFGNLEYIERILIDSSGDTYYLSESKANWAEGGESGVEYQTEISRKIIPDFNIGEISKGLLTGNTIKINNSKSKINEICEVIVTEVYGENSKSYTIGEKIITYQFDKNGLNFVLEKEQTNSQSEIGIYHTREINDNDLRDGNIGYNSNMLKLGNHIGKKIIFSFILFLISFFYFSSVEKIGSVDTNSFQSITLKEAKGLYKINFGDNYKVQISDLTTNYDYGGVKHNIKKIEGIKFKIETQEDLNLLKKLLSGEENITLNQVSKYDLSNLDKNISNYFTKNSITNYK